MSLLAQNMSNCIMMDKRAVSDGYGGYSIEWIEGAEIQAAIVHQNDNQTRIAEAQGTKAIYTITTKRNINLQYHDTLKRQSDGKIFRITSDGDDNKTPNGAGLDMRQVTAEEWELV